MSVSLRFALIATLSLAPRLADAGRNTWTHTSTGLNGGAITHIAVSPNFANDRTMFASADFDYGGGAIFKSTDGGASWTWVFKDLPIPIVDMVVSPTFQKGQTVFVLATMYAGDPSGALARSYDGGATWSYIAWDREKHDTNSFGILASLGVSPNYAIDKTLLVGDWIGNIFRSTDGGSSWHAYRRTTGAVQGFAFSPNFATDHTVFASDGGVGVSKSVDGGVTWTPFPFGPSLFIGHRGQQGVSTSVIAVSPNFPVDQTVFAGTWGDGVFKSSNGGTSWAPAGSLYGAKYGDASIQSLIVSPNFARDRTIWALTSRLGAWQSTDSGMTWQRFQVRFDSAPRVASTGRTQVTESSGPAVHMRGLQWSVGRPDRGASARGAPAVPHTVAPFGSMLSRGAGAAGRFATFGINARREATVGQVALDPLAIAISPGFANDKLVFAGTEVGLLASRDNGATSTLLNEGITAVSVYEIRVSPGYQLDKTLFADTDFGLYKSTDAGQSWQRKRDPCTIVLSSNYASDSTILALDWPTNSLHRSQDGGESWTQIASGFVPADYLVLDFKASPDYSKDRTLFVSGVGGILKSLDGGSSWSLSNAGLTNLDVEAFAISPNWAKDKTLFAGTSAGTFEERNGGVFRSRDGGDSWERLKGPWPDYGHSIGTISFSPGYAADHTVFVTSVFLSVFIYRSTDGGDTWQEVNSSPSANTLVLSPNYVSDQTLFTGTGDGEAVWKSNDGGLSWVKLDAGLGPSRYIATAALAVTPTAPTTLFAGGSWSTGVWQYTFDEVEVVNAASLRAGPLTYGEIVSIFGSNFGPATPLSMKIEPGRLIATSLGDVRVVLRYRAGTGENKEQFAPLLFVSDRQVNAVVPYELGLGCNQTSSSYSCGNGVTLTVEHGGREVGISRLPWCKTVPGIFTVTGTGIGQGAILNDDYSANSANNPAARGSGVTLYVAGAGNATWMSLYDGRVLPANPPEPLPFYWPKPYEKVSARAGGVDAEVSFAGGAPGLVAGVTQVNIRIPSNVTPGAAVPVEIIVGDFASQPGVTASQPGVTMAIK